MTNIDYRLEPFDEPTLACIRNAYRRAWPHVQLAKRDSHIARNRLIGTLATLAGGGISDPERLKQEALKVLGT